MVRFGTVIHVNRATNSGVIRDDKTQKDFFFDIHECVDNELPGLWTTVTYLKDKDYKTTDVACLIKPSKIFRTKKSA